MPQISEAEARVMEVLWAAAGPLSADDIEAALKGATTWQLATIKTLLNRLLKKGAIGANKEGRRYLYSPRLARQAWTNEQTMGFIERLFGGSLAPLVTQFSSQHRLRPDEVQALKQVLSAYELSPPQEPQLPLTGETTPSCEPQRRPNVGRTQP